MYLHLIRIHRMVVHAPSDHVQCREISTVRYKQLDGGEMTGLDDNGGRGVEKEDEKDDRKRNRSRMRRKKKKKKKKRKKKEKKKSRKRNRYRKRKRPRRCLGLG